jgi:hypothetical protein
VVSLSPALTVMVGDNNKKQVSIEIMGSLVPARAYLKCFFKIEKDILNYHLLRIFLSPFMCSSLRPKFAPLLLLLRGLSWKPLRGELPRTRCLEEEISQNHLGETNTSCLS